MDCPNCGDPDAECLVGQYWRCPRRGCKYYHRDEWETQTPVMRTRPLIDLEWPLIEWDGDG